MAPTPWNPSGRLDIVYGVDGLVHRTRFPVNTSNTTGPWLIEDFNTGAFDGNPGTIASQIWSFAQGWYPTSVAAPAWQLYQKSGISFIPVASGTVTGTGGTNTNPYAKCSEFTITFKDAANKLFKSVWLETVYGAPQKSIVNATPLSVANYIIEIIRAGGSPQIGDYVRGRSGYVITRNLRWTVTLNRKLRRSRDLA